MLARLGKATFGPQARTGPLSENVDSRVATYFVAKKTNSEKQLKLKTKQTLFVLLVKFL